MICEIAKAKGEKILCLRWMNPFVKLAFVMPGTIGKMVKKAFGSMTIDKELSLTISDYQRFDLKESIQRSISSEK